VRGREALRAGVAESAHDKEAGLITRLDVFGQEDI